MCFMGSFVTPSRDLPGHHARISLLQDQITHSNQEECQGEEREELIRHLVTPSEFNGKTGKEKGICLLDFGHQGELVAADTVGFNIPGKKEERLRLLPE